MTRRTGRSIIAMLTIALITSACGGGATLSDPGGSATSTEPVESTTITPTEIDAATDPEVMLPSEPNPASVSITLEQGTAATATIGAEGGSFKTTDARGTEYTLTIPEGALFSPEEITMTPIASAEGEAIGDTFLGGVTLQPEGLYFLELVTIAITADAIEAGAVGFSAERGGQDFHLTPSESADGSLTISTTHFSEFLTSQDVVEEVIQAIVPLAEMAQIEHQLVLGSDAQALAALSGWIESLQEAGEIGSFEEWRYWTAELTSLFLRFIEVLDDREWNEITPTPRSLTELRNDVKDLVGQWFQQSDDLVRTLGEQCIQGELEAFARISQIIEVGTWIGATLGLVDLADVGPWRAIKEGCVNLGVTWQANVVTTGGEFFSDISIGSELRFSGVGQASPVLTTTALEVEYIDGFWLDTCVGTPGAVGLGVKIDFDFPNLGSTIGGSLNNITVFVSIVNQVYIDCSPAGFEISAAAQVPFHGGALEAHNMDRRNLEGQWEFELAYEPGGGVVAQLEEGPVTFSWSEGEYNVWQLISVYQNTPVN